MLKDIYNAYGIKGNTLNVFQRDFSERENKGENILKILNEICEESKKTGIPLIDLIHEYEEELNRYYEYTIPSGDTKTIKTGNHKITTAVYQGNTYYLDPTQSRIYKPSTILEDYLSDTIAVRDTKIIPSVNKKVIKTLTTSCTPFSEDQVYIDETKLIYEQNRDVFEDFYREHQELYSDISSELSKIKVKRKKK